jgi:hypothetical protein
MIKNDQKLQATLERIRYFHQQVEKLRLKHNVWLLIRY